MPFTLSHPAAVVPLARFFRSQYTVSALVIGSMVPDFEYFFHLRPKAVIGHEPLGLVVFCLPVGLVALWLAHAVVKRPAFALLPRRLQHRLAGWIRPSSRVSFRQALLLGALVIAGAVTHIVWDSFTHAGRGLVARVPVLSATVVQIGGVDIGLFKMLQHTSTVVGLAIVVFALVRAVRRLEPSTAAVPELPAWVRWIVVVALGCAAGVGAVVAGMAGRGQGAFVRQIQFGAARGAVVCLAILAAGLIVYGLAFPALERRLGE